ncbi:hypothetical protein [Oricola cellulosilytica]|uniref:hypothetical protein n=1 Tax=Oricola cellulosilytica TaxID=1429082 RepID=UPI001CBB3574|nr:hypothetical protein [Oricola cellulosilytica]
MARFSETRIGRALSATGGAIVRARHAEALSRLPDHIFEERGTTRESELRDLFGLR